MTAPTQECWKADADLACIRDVEGMANSPNEETSASRRLWTDVDGLLTGMAARK